MYRGWIFDKMYTTGINIWLERKFFHFLNKKIYLVNAIIFLVTRYMKKDKSQ